MSEWLLLPIAFATSTLAATIGMGGGVLLIATMPGLVPAPAILPLHAVVQLASNGTRCLFGWRHIAWSLVPPLLIGAVLGAWLGGEVYLTLDLRWLPALIGVVILAMTWLPLPRPGGAGPWSLLLLGFYQTGIGMLVGATGPLGAAVLLRHNRDKHWLVVNSAVYMGLNHLCRTLAFLLLGFSFYPWLALIALLVLAVTAGSWVGTRLRERLPQRNFQRAFSILLSLLALRMIYLSVTAGASP